MQTRKAVNRQVHTDMPRESFGELLSQLANNSAALVRDEIDLAKQEMGEKIARLRSAVVVIAIGGVIALVGMLGLVAAAIIGLGYVVGPGWSALIIGGALALIGGLIAMTGVGRMKRTSLKPEQTIETLEEDKEWLKQLT
ncbi:MAG TPA: phage holin family protein [Blastocatellia bacterium]|nr:phage holin family protein [Blastocatellia bacterium]